MGDAPARRDLVGPVLHAGPAARAVVAAIEALNADVEVVDRGAYVRVSAPRRCAVTRAAIEARTRGPFRLPGDLERIMPAFKGRICFTDEAVVWELAAPAGQD